MHTISGSCIQFCSSNSNYLEKHKKRTHAIFNWKYWYDLDRLVITLRSLCSHNIYRLERQLQRVVVSPMMWVEFCAHCGFGSRSSIHLKVCYYARKLVVPTHLLPRKIGKRERDKKYIIRFGFHALLLLFWRIWRLLSNTTGGEELQMTRVLCLYHCLVNGARSK